MKKLLAVLLALVMLVSLAACADNTDKDNPSSDAPANSDNPSMKANVNKKIAMIMQQGGLGDQGFNDTAYAGLMTCKEKYDLDVNAVEYAARMYRICSLLAPRSASNSCAVLSLGDAVCGSKPK